MPWPQAPKRRRSYWISPRLQPQRYNRGSLPLMSDYALMTRRSLLRFSLAGAAAARWALAKSGKLKIGVTDWNLELGASTDAVPLAAKLGFSGVQVSFGRKLVDGKLP